VLFIVGALAWNQYFGQASMALRLPEKPCLAVLPFENLSGEPTWDRLANGITEDVITNLSLARDLFVIAPNSTLVYKD
jgi:TolB-like protein